MGSNSRLLALVISAFIVLAIILSGLALVYYNFTNNTNTLSDRPSTLSITSMFAIKLTASELRTLTPDYFNAVNVPNVSYSLQINMMIYLNKSYILYTQGLNICSFSSNLVNTSVWKFATLVINCPTFVDQTFNTSTHYFSIGEILVPVDYNYTVTYPINLSIIGISTTFPLKLTSNPFSYQINQ